MLTPIGYNFKSAQDIEPFLEHSGSGITSLWARTIALKYNCVVTVGYPEKVDASGHSGGPKYYNSALVINGDGETIANYRKSFLYHTDETWAREGEDGFFNGFIPGLGKLSIGICTLYYSLHTLVRT
jgi:protein N-terminal amidase